MNRQQQIDEFYDLMVMVEQKFSKQRLADMNKKNVPEKGVYFFFEGTELRDNKLDGRIVRIGTHGVQNLSKATMYNRLSNHRGSKKLLGNHRGSVFRELVGRALIQRDNIEDYQHWGSRAQKGNKEVRNSEKEMEVTVSQYLSQMKFIVLEVPGDSSKDNDRAYIERNSIALLSNFNKKAIDAPSEKWLGNFTGDNKIVKSGLWNRDYVDREVEVGLWDKIQFYLREMKRY